MGRGRAKAKQTRVARELKYSSGGTDLDRLRAELAGEPVVARPVESEPPSDEDDEYADPYADAFADEDDEADDDPTGQDHRTA